MKKMKKMNIMKIIKMIRIIEKKIKELKKNIEHKNRVISRFFHKNQNPVLMPKSGSRKFFSGTRNGLMVTVVDGLPCSPNCAWCKVGMLGTCAGYFCSKKIEFVALAIKIIRYIIIELRQNSMHFVKKSFRRRVEIIWIFFYDLILWPLDHLRKSKKNYKVSLFALVA